MINVYSRLLVVCCRLKTNKTYTVNIASEKGKKTWRRFSAPGKGGKKFLAVKAAQIIVSKLLTNDFKYRKPGIVINYQIVIFKVANKK
jgi:hypothetical protein